MLSPGSVEIIVDEQGTMGVITLDSGLYSEEVALKAAYGLSDRCYIHIRRNKNGILAAEIRVKDGASLSLAEACGEFYNAVVDFALRERISAECSGLQEALLARAFVQLLPRAAGGG